MLDPGGPPRILIPRWIQLVSLPLLLLALWAFAGAAFHVVVAFVIAALVALLLNPLVRAIGSLHVPRGLAVAIVYLAFLGALAVTIGALATVVVGQTRTAANRVDAYFTKPVEHGQTAADRDVDRFQRRLNTHHLRHPVRVQPGAQGEKRAHGGRELRNLLGAPTAPSRYPRTSGHCALCTSSAAARSTIVSIAASPRRRNGGRRPRSLGEQTSLIGVLEGDSPAYRGGSNAMLATGSQAP